MRKIKYVSSIYGIAAVAIVTLSSCDKNSETLTEQAPDYKFLSTFEHSETSKKSWWVIADFDLGRESQDCISGFGVCNWDWFPGWDKVNHPPTNGHIQVPLLWDDTLQKHYVEFLIDPASSPAQSIFYLDNDLTNTIKIDKDSETIIFPKGKYLFNPSLGRYGGYRVTAK